MVFQIFNRDVQYSNITTSNYQIIKKKKKKRKKKKKQFNLLCNCTCLWLIVACLERFNTLLEDQKKSFNNFFFFCKDSIIVLRELLFVCFLQIGWVD